jgi:hypothetical protein
MENSFKILANAPWNNTHSDKITGLTTEESDFINWAVGQVYMVHNSFDYVEHLKQLDFLYFRPYGGNRTDITLPTILQTLQSKSLKNLPWGSSSFMSDASNTLLSGRIYREKP